MTLAMEGRYHPWLSQGESALERSTVLSACVLDILNLWGLSVYILPFCLVALAFRS